LTLLVTQSALADLLSAWLPAQRWYAGGAQKCQVAITSDVRLADTSPPTRTGPATSSRTPAGRADRTKHPELRHLMADAWQGREKVTYQVPVGIRAQLPAELAGAKIGRLPDGRIAYDGTADPKLTASLLRGIAAQRTAGPLRFATEPGAIIDETAAGRTLPALASNTSIVFGDKAILKLLRRPFTGHHPDLEVPAALARNGSKLVAAPLGWIEMPGEGGEPAVLAILSVYFPHSTDGWSLATASLHAPDQDFANQADLLGEATASLHAELAEAFGTGVLSRHSLADLTGAMQTELTKAITVVPSLREHETAVRACYEAITGPDSEIEVQRIHGDYHLAQVLGTERGWVVLDFEGEPSVPLARRRCFAPALRDVAGMLRSFDYAARHETLRRPDNRLLADAAAVWVRRCQDAFCSGYAQVMGRDPRTSGPLLRALTLQKAVYEAVYEARHRPDWLPIPLAAIAEASR
jgi:maltokinase